MKKGFSLLWMLIEMACAMTVFFVGKWIPMEYRQRIDIKPDIIESVQSPTPTPDATPTPVFVKDVQGGRVAYGLMTLVNAERARAGAPALTELSALDAGAANRASYISRTGQWSHGGQNAQMRASLGYPTRGRGGENLAKGYANEQEVINGWLASPTHKAVMLDKSFVYGGVGHSNGIWVLWLSTPYGWK